MFFLLVDVLLFYNVYLCIGCSSALFERFFCGLMWDDGVGFDFFCKTKSFMFHMKHLCYNKLLWCMFVLMGGILMKSFDSCSLFCVAN